MAPRPSTLYDSDSRPTASIPTNRSRCWRWANEYMETLLAGVGVSQKKLEQNRDEVKRVVRALLRALDFMHAQPVEAKNLIQKRLGVSEMDIVDHIYGLVTKYATRNGIPSQKAIENTLLGTLFEGKLTNFDKLTDFSGAREVAEGK